jgi:hypothetical protein
MALTISVTPQQDWWLVHVGTCENDMAFFSGAKAEAAARGLAQRMAARGVTTAILVYLRDGSVAGRFICAPEREEMALAS